MRLFRRPGRLDAVMWTGFAIAAAGLLWSFWPSPGIDHDYFARIRGTYGRRGPTVMIDEAHWNVDRADGRYRPFVHLLRRDGYRVVRNKQEFVPGLFAGIHVLVIANALGFKGTLQRVANAAGFVGKVHLEADAFDSGEVNVVRDWVRSGGSLLLVADHAPYGSAARKMAAAFGVEMSEWRAGDRESATRFERGRGLEDHPIIQGSSDRDETVYSVVMQAGQSLTPHRDAAVFLRLPETGAAQGVALEYGKGRAVVMADAGSLTARVAGRSRIGINSSDMDNQQLALNIMHWLTRVL
jgi:hypothetical protein